MQGQKIQIELWKLLEDDPRWIKTDNPELKPTKFNPDRQVVCQYQAVYMARMGLLKSFQVA